MAPSVKNRVKTLNKLGTVNKIETFRLSCERTNVVENKMYVSPSPLAANNLALRAGTICAFAVSSNVLSSMVMKMDLRLAYRASTDKKGVFH